MAADDFVGLASLQSYVEMQWAVFQDFMPSCRNGDRLLIGRCQSIVGRYGANPLQRLVVEALGAEASNAIHAFVVLLGWVIRDDTLPLICYVNLSKDEGHLTTQINKIYLAWQPRMMVSLIVWGWWLFGEVFQAHRRFGHCNFAPEEVLLGFGLMLLYAGEMDTLEGVGTLLQGDQLNSFENYSDKFGLPYSNDGEKLTIK